MAMMSQLSRLKKASYVSYPALPALRRRIFIKSSECLSHFDGLVQDWSNSRALIQYKDVILPV